MSTTQSFLTTATKTKAASTIPTLYDSTITLHALCESCQNFFRSWGVIEAVHNPSKLQDQLCQTALLCTVAHLIQSYKDCHFCTSLLASLKRFPNTDFESKRNAHVYLGAIAGGDGVVVQVYLSNRTPVEDEGRRPVAAFPLQVLQCE
jgi:hypothetical protein